MNINEIDILKNDLKILNMCLKFTPYSFIIFSVFVGVFVIMGLLASLYENRLDDFPLLLILAFILWIMGSFFTISLYLGLYVVSDNIILKLSQLSLNSKSELDKILHERDITYKDLFSLEKHIANKLDDFYLQNNLADKRKTLQ